MRTCTPRESWGDPAHFYAKGKKKTIRGCWAEKRITVLALGQNGEVRGGGRRMSKIREGKRKDDRSGPLR